MKPIPDIELQDATHEALAARRDLFLELAADKRDSVQARLWAEALARSEEILEVLTNIRTLLGQTVQQKPVAAAAMPATTPSSAAASQAAYAELVLRIRRLVDKAIPAGATVLVVSKGDDALLQLGTRRAWHFPQMDGCYAGSYPPDSASAIAHLEALREKGADHFLFPATALWWLDHYAGLRAHLEAHYPVKVRERDTCLIFALRGAANASPSPGVPSPGIRYEHLVRQIRELAASVLPPGARIAVVSKGDPELLKLGSCAALHFPQGDGGQYAGHYPSDTEAVLKALEQLGFGGAEFLLFPATAFWWLDHYTGLGSALEARGRLVVSREHVCKIFDLRTRSQ